MERRLESLGCVGWIKQLGRLFTLASPFFSANWEESLVGGATRGFVIFF